MCYRTDRSKFTLKSSFVDVMAVADSPAGTPYATVVSTRLSDLRNA